MIDKKYISIAGLLLLMSMALPVPGHAWHDQTHLAIAKAAGYGKWYNATGADMAKLKAGNVEMRNHYVNNAPDDVVTADMVLEQIAMYDDPGDAKGHLYGAVLGALREYKKTKIKGKYAEYHLAFCAHYLGDLSQPLHNTAYNKFNRRHHNNMDGVINARVLDNLDRIKIYPIEIRSEKDLAKEIARLANLSLKMGVRLEAEDRLLTEQEAYAQISHSASLFKAVLAWLGK